MAYQYVSDFVCVCVWRQSVFVSERQVMCPHVAPAVAQLKNIFG